jgi:ATP-dependent protease HslVU (ClpYQ) peptidase subunit
MTTIVALQGSEWSLIASDSRITDDSGRYASLSSETPKVFSRGEYVISAAGDVRAINILSHVFVPPKPRQGSRSSLDEFMTSAFVPALRECFEEQGYAGRESKDQATNCSVVIVSVCGVIYEIDEDYSWSRNTTGIYTAGTGGDFAAGAVLGLLKTEQLDDLEVEQAEDIARKAVDIATMFDSSSGGAVQVIKQMASKTKRRQSDRLDEKRTVRRTRTSLL